jgi:hypothetical protein
MGHVGKMRSSVLDTSVWKHGRLLILGATLNTEIFERTVN